MPGKNEKSASEIDVNQLVAESDSGGRKPGPSVGKLILGVCLAWSLFQLWIASPLPFTLGIGVFNDTQSRAIHLAFAVFLAYLAYPAFGGSPRDRVPLLYSGERLIAVAGLWIDAAADAAPGEPGLRLQWHGCAESASITVRLG